MSGDDTLKQEYLEAVQLYLWYKGSPFSFHRGKANKDLAEWHRTELHFRFQKYIESGRR